MDLEPLYPIAKDAGFGMITGLTVGYALKKVAKVAAIMIGLFFILIQVAVHYGLITINWDVVQNTFKMLYNDVSGQSSQWWKVLTANLPFLGAFSTGFAIGFKKG